MIFMDMVNSKGGTIWKVGGNQGFCFGCVKFGDLLQIFT